MHHAAKSRAKLSLFPVMVCILGSIAKRCVDLHMVRFKLELNEVNSEQS